MISSLFIRFQTLTAYIAFHFTFFVFFFLCLNVDFCLFSCKFLLSPFVWVWVCLFFIVYSNFFALFRLFEFADFIINSIYRQPNIRLYRPYHLLGLTTRSLQLESYLQSPTCPNSPAASESKEYVCRKATNKSDYDVRTGCSWLFLLFLNSSPSSSSSSSLLTFTSEGKSV